MNYPDTRRWIKLALSNKAGNLLFTYYEDGLGNKINLIDNGSPEELNKIDELIRIVINEPNSHHSTREGFKEIPLPVYLDGGVSIRAYFDAYWFGWRFQWLFDPFLRSRFSSLQDVIIQPINYIQTKKSQHFQLPLSVHWDIELREYTERLFANAGWYQYNDAVREFGFRMSSTNWYDLMEDRDIIVLRSGSYGELQKLYSDRKRALPLLLVVLVDRVMPPNDYHTPDNFPCPTLAIHAPESLYRDILEELIYCIIHDYALHEAVYSLEQKFDTEQRMFTLYASPESNHNLRMHKAVESFQNKVEQYVRVLNPGDTKGFIQKFDVTGNVIGGKVSKAFSLFDANNISTLQHLASFTTNFHGEGTGLVPLSYQAAEFFRIKKELNNARNELSLIVGDEDVFSFIRENQERVVDITMDEFTPFLLYRPVNGTSSLVPNADHRLNVSIGQKSEFSLMEGDIPSLDPLLPDPENSKGHLLSIVVYAKDFTLLSESRKDVYLPLLGGTEKASFSLRAPTTNGLAELRVAVFYKNSLLQAFLLTAQVGEVSVLSEGKPVKVVLDLAASSKFTNLDSLRSPDLYIGMNKGINNEHSLFMKTDTHNVEMDLLTDAVYGNIQQEFRQLLDETYFTTDKYPRLTVENEKLVFAGNFESVLRKFGRLGAECYQKIFTGDVDLGDTLRAIANSEEPRKILIGRHNPNHAFPWPLLYDFQAPLPVKGKQDTYPICYGKKFEDGEHDQFKNKRGYGCQHNPDTHVWCIDGFWGTRNIIEQLPNVSSATDLKDEVHRTEPEMFYSCNLRDYYADALTKKMANAAPRVKVINTDSLLIDDLWDEKLRPSSVVLFGHLDCSLVDGEPDPPRIMTFPKEDWKSSYPIPPEKWVTSENIFRLRKTGRWKSHPLPIVFLVNCSTGRLAIDSMNSIVAEFYQSGASAVVATECNITTPLGTSFVEKITRGLYEENKKLGEAIRIFNRDLLLQKIPLPFVFTCYGNSNLTII